MAKLKVQNQQCEPDNDVEPNVKRPRIYCSQRQQQKFRKCKNVVRNSSLSICDLPTEILEKIMGKINIWHHNRIRGTSKRMKEVNDIFVMHEFQKALKKQLSQDAKSESSAALRIIDQATEVYRRSGFESTFCGCILPMLRSSYRNPFCPHISQIRKFLVHFYAMITDLIGDSSSQRWRLLYSITLMRLVRSFDKSIISSTAMPLHWRTVVELRGPWLGILWSCKIKTLNQSSNRCNLLVILSEMLLANITGTSFKQVWECPHEMYVFGNDTSNDKQVPVTIFTFTLYGSKKMRNLFRSCLVDDTELFEWPSKWPNDQFTLNLDIACKEAMKWGCSKSQHMEFGPFAETIFSEEEETVN